MTGEGNASEEKGSDESPHIDIAVSVFSENLDRLFHSAADRCGRRMTQAGLADEINARGYTISRAYISQLRGGTRTNPSEQLVTVIADIFGVDEDYFSIPPIAPHRRAETNDTAILEHLHSKSFAALLARADGLSSHSIELVIEIAERLRIAERLPELRLCANMRHEH